MAHWPPPAQPCICRHTRVARALSLRHTRLPYCSLCGLTLKHPLPVCVLQSRVRLNSLRLTLQTASYELERIDQQGGAAGGTRYKRRAGRCLDDNEQGSLKTSARFPMKVEKGPECVTPGLPSHDCILLVKPRNRGIDSVIAVGVHKVKPCS
jgi:hypothetical protein